MVTIRPLQIPDDFPALVDLMNARAPEPLSLEAVLEMEKRNTGFRHRIVAVDQAGALLGYAYVRRSETDPPGFFFVSTNTAGGAERQGIGTALLAEVERWAREAGASRLESAVPDDAPESLAFARRKGYEIRRHLFASEQNLATFDPAAFAAHVERVRAQGIRFFPLAEAPGEEAVRKLYDLYTAAEMDTPGLELERPTFEHWRQLTVDRKGFRPETAVIAADGDRWVGCTVLTDVIGKDGVLYIRFTGTDREYRGRGLALAMKVLAAEAARALGVRVIRTNNDSENGPMLAVNRKLGYQPLPGLYFVTKPQ